MDLKKAEDQFGSVHAAALVTFISDAISFENAGELIDFLGDDAKVSVDDVFSTSIGSDYRATLVAVGQRFECDVDGRVVWTSVTRLKLVSILETP